jgi:hypothetical protein
MIDNSNNRDHFEDQKQCSLREILLPISPNQKDVSYAPQAIRREGVPECYEEGA